MNSKYKVTKFKKGKLENVNEELVVKTFVKGNENNYLNSGKNKIELSENPNVIIWGVVTYVIHKFH